MDPAQVADRLDLLGGIALCEFEIDDVVDDALLQSVLLGVLGQGARRPAPGVVDGGPPPQATAAVEMKGAAGVAGGIRKALGNDEGGANAGRGRLPDHRDSIRGPWVSRAKDLLAPDVPFDACRDLLFGLLDRMAMR